MAVKNYGIHDKWTNINKVNNVEIQSVDGVIENIKVNGEPAGGGGELSTAEVTFYAPSGVEVGINGIIIVSDDGIEYPTSGEYNVNNNDQIKAVLFKGVGYINIRKNMYVQEVTVAGDAIANSDESYFYITVTGDCTITIS